jgi:hypothetical protein
MKNENGIYQNEHLMRFTEKPWYEHLGAFCNHLRSESSNMFVIVITFGGSVYALVEALGSKATIGSFAWPIVTVAVVVIFYRAHNNYKNYAPEALQDESDTVKRIYREQRCGWQFNLAKQMLYDRTTNIDLTLNQIKRGAVFIAPEYLSPTEYYEWLTLRPVALSRLVDSVMVQCTDEMPAFLKDVDRGEKMLPEFKGRIIALTQLYEQTKLYEIECYQILPQDPFTKLHELTKGWTEPIQKGINEFMQILTVLSTIDRKLLKKDKVQPPKFNIIIKAPENVKEFCIGLDMIAARND